LFILGVLVFFEEGETVTERERETDRQRDRERERETERQRDRDRETEGLLVYFGSSEAGRQLDGGMKTFGSSTPNTAL